MVLSHHMGADVCGWGTDPAFLTAEPSLYPPPALILICIRIRHDLFALDFFGGCLRKFVCLDRRKLAHWCPSCGLE